MSAVDDGQERDKERAMMTLALKRARLGAARGEVPVGAVVAIEGKVVAQAHNRPLALNDPTAHAEILALRRAARAVGAYRLTGATIYVTLEPCVMCVGALVNARVARLRFGANDPKAGAIGSVYDIGRDGLLNHRIEARGGIMAEECAEVLRAFFAARRRATPRSKRP